MPDEPKPTAEPKPDASWIARVVQSIIDKVFSQAGAVGVLLLVVLYGGFLLYEKNIESHQLIVDKFNSTMLEMQKTDADNRAVDRDKMQAHDLERSRKTNALVKEQTKILQAIDSRMEDHHKVEERMIKAIEAIGRKMP